MERAMTNPDNSNQDKDFGEFRRKVREAEVLSASMERLLLSVRFSGRVSVLMQNGRVPSQATKKAISGREEMMRGRMTR